MLIQSTESLLPLLTLKQVKKPSTFEDLFAFLFTFYNIYYSAFWIKINLFFKISTDILQLIDLNPLDQLSSPDMIMIHHHTLY